MSRSDGRDAHAHLDLWHKGLFTTSRNVYYLQAIRGLRMLTLDFRHAQCGITCSSLLKPTSSTYSQCKMCMLRLEYACAVSSAHAQFAYISRQGACAFILLYSIVYNVCICIKYIL